MFKEIESEFLSLISDDAMERIAHMPTKTIAKTMDLLYNIEFESIDRVYTEKFSDDITRMTVLYTSDKTVVATDLVPIDGKVYHLTIIPSCILNTDEHNAVSLTSAVITYVAHRCNLIRQKYESCMKLVQDNMFSLILYQSIPIITTSIIRQIYTGPQVSNVIYMSLRKMLPVYKDLYTETSIKSIITLLDESLTVEDLLDNGFIGSIPAGDDQYPDIWPQDRSKNESKVEVEVTPVEESK